MKQTAMQMAINHYKKLSEQGSNQAYVVAKFLEENFLEVEEQQIIDSYIECKRQYIIKESCFPPQFVVKEAEQYYNKTFKSE